MAISPDTKDWTWVLERPCDQCGFHADAVPTNTIAARVNEHAEAWKGVLRRSDVRVRPSNDKWSTLEYGCHVRDVLRIFDERLSLMLAEEDPIFANWDQDATAIEESYDLQDPGDVSRELRAAASRVADRFDWVAPSQWARPGNRSNGSRFTVESLGRYSLHDVVHHLWDVAG